jgi:serine/threonine protein kinase
MSDPRVGTLIAGHRVESVIGRGATSTVYLAEHLRLGRKVALKILVPDLAQDTHFRERFVRESQLAAGLDHPNVVTVYDAGEVDGMLFISMRYVEGVDLRELFKREGPLEVGRALSITEQVASALDAAHRAGLVHRDVKPANVLASEPRESGGPDRVFLSDFGITKLSGSSGRLTRSGEFVGTVDYIAPEQILGEDVDGRADVYSLGCVLFEALTGTAPYRDRGGDVAVIYAHLNDPPPPPSSRRADLPEALDTTVARALSKRREDRYSTCSDLVRAAKTSLLATSPRAGGHRETRVIAARNERARSHRRRARWLAAGLASLVALAAAGILVVREPGSKPPASGHSPALKSSTSPSQAALASIHPHVLSWSQVPRQSSLGGAGDQTMLRGLEAGGELVAVGYTALPRDPVTNARNYDAAVWTSSNATIWNRRPDPVFALPGKQRATAVAEIAGTLVVGGSDDSGGDKDAAVWTSVNGGSDWERIDPLEPAFHLSGDQGIRDIAATDSGLVAVGFDGASQGDDGAVWTSGDGTHWSRELTSGLSAAGDQEMDSVVDFGGLLVASGYDQTGTNRDAAVWTSSDSVNWVRAHDPSLGGPGAQQINMLAVTGTGLVAVGQDTTPNGTDAAVWTSAGGRQWTRVDESTALAGPGDRLMSSVVYVDNTLVTAGTETVSHDPNGAIWVSGDGKNWKQERPDSIGAGPLTGLGVQRLQWIMFGANHLVVLGRTGRRRNDAAAWIAAIPRH